MTNIECRERLENIINNSCTYDYCTFEINENKWEKGDKSRTYFAIVEKSVDYKVSKHYKKKSYGYIDNTTGEYYPEKYGDLRDNFTFSGARF